MNEQISQLAGDAASVVLVLTDGHIADEASALNQVCLVYHDNNVWIVV